MSYNRSTACEWSILSDLGLQLVLIDPNLRPRPLPRSVSKHFTVINIEVSDILRLTAIRTLEKHYLIYFSALEVRRIQYVNLFVYVILSINGSISFPVLCVFNISIFGLPLLPRALRIIVLSPIYPALPVTPLGNSSF